MKTTKKDISLAFSKQIKDFSKLSKNVIEMIQKEFKIEIKTGEKIPGGHRWYLIKVNSSYQSRIELYLDGDVHVLLHEIRQGGNSGYLIPTTKDPYVFNLTDEDSIVKIIMTLKTFKLE